MANRDELLRAALQNAQATQAQVGYDEQYERALALRDSQYREPSRRTGVVSPLSVLATTIRKSRGRRDERGVTGPRDANRELMGSSSGVLNQGKLGLTLDKAAREVSKLKLLKKKGALDEAELEWKKQVRLGEGVTYIKKGEPDILVGHNSKNEPQLYKDGKWHNVPEGYVPKFSKGSSSGGRPPGKAYSYTQSQDISELISSVVNTSSLSTTFKDEYAQPTGLPTEFINNLGSAMSRNDLMKYIGPDADDSIKAAAQWWASWRMFYTLPLRHKNFGSQLSRHEEKAWKEAELMRPGMDPAEIRKRVETLTRIASEVLLRQANIQMADPLESNRNYWIRGLGQSGLTDYDEERRFFSPKSTEPPLETEQVPEQVPEATLEPLREVTQEEKVIYGKIVTGFDEVDMKKYIFKPDGTKRTAEEQRRLLDFLFNKQQNTLNE